MMAKRQGPKKWLVLMAGGFLATIVITVVVHPLAAALGFPEFDFARGLARILTFQNVALFSPGWWMGLAVHFFNGAILFPSLFGLLEGRLSRYGAMGAALGFAVGLWLLSQTVLLPLAGLGFFARRTDDPAVATFISFNAHVLYGIILGLFEAHLIRDEMAHSPRWERRAA
jgi:hypothetical protein